MSDPVYDEWDAVKFGHDGTSQRFPLIESPGLLGLSNNGDDLTGGFNGAGATPLYSVKKSWTTVTGVEASSDSEWRTKRDELRAATSSTAEGQYTVHDAGQVRTVFARVIARDIPRDAEAEVWHNTEASITFEAIDPIIYGPVETEDFTGTSDSLLIDTDGWVPTERWRWTVPGPANRPKLSSSVHPTAVVRYRGDIPDGYTLVVELLPKGSSPGYYAKIVADADVADYRTWGVGTNAYPLLDAGASFANIPPQWFPIADGITVTWAASSGDGCTFEWRPGYD